MLFELSIPSRLYRKIVSVRALRVCKGSGLQGFYSLYTRSRDGHADGRFDCGQYVRMTLIAQGKTTQEISLHLSGLGSTSDDALRFNLVRRTEGPGRAAAAFRNEKFRGARAGDSGGSAREGLTHADGARFLRPERGTVGVP